MNKFVASVNASHAEATFNVPASKIWPYVVNPSEYLTGYTFTHVSGEPGKVNEIQLVECEYPKGSGYKVRQYYKTLAIAPERFWIIATSASGISSTDPTTLDDAEGSNTWIVALNENNGKTILTSSVVKHGRSTKQNQDEIDSLGRKYSDAATQAWNTQFFPKIRELVEE